jgi:hypothetical protein
MRLCFRLNVLSTTSSLSAIAHHKKTPFAVIPRQGFLGTDAFTGMRRFNKLPVAEAEPAV